jgi:hypothetical protein
MIMNHEESKLQRQCVAWFRAQYPQYAMLLTHPINEGSGHTTTDRRRQGIHKAEGAVAGVPDLILFMHGRQHYKESGISMSKPASALGIEMKTAKGRQSQQQKDFQEVFEAAGYMYAVVRSIDEFRGLINGYIGEVNPEVRRDIASANFRITKAAEQREKEKFYKVIGKK